MFKKQTNKTTTKENWLPKPAEGRALDAGLQMATSSRLLILMGYSSERHQLLPCIGFYLVKQFELSAMTSSPGKFAECL